MSEPGSNDLQFALGQLTGQTRALVEEQARLREAHADLPSKIVNLLEPRFALVDTRLADHEGRIRVVEQREWKVLGGGAVIFAILGVILGGWHPIHIPFIR